MNSEDDRRLFDEAMRGVTPLPRTNRAVLERRKRKRVIVHARRAAGPHTTAASRALRELARGALRIEAELDLHGKSAAEAERLLAEFVVQARAYGIGCVRIVHGRGVRSGPGGPVLKSLVQRWLAASDDVLGFTAARPRDGGDGAVYALLGRR